MDDNENNAAAGVVAEQPPPSYDSSARPIFGSLSLPEHGTIRLVQFSQSDIETVRKTIERIWCPGIRAEKAYSVSHEFKLKATPWIPRLQECTAVSSIRLIKGILASLYSLGWVLTTTSTVTRKVSGKNTLILRQQSILPPVASWVAISFKSNNKLRFLGYAPSLISAFSALFTGTCFLQSHIVKRANYSQFNLHGSPWEAKGKAAIRAKLLVMRMTEILEMQGWSLFASIDQSGVKESEVWYCMRPRGWTPGSIAIEA